MTIHVLRNAHFSLSFKCATSVASRQIKKKKREPRQCFKKSHTVSKKSHITQLLEFVHFCEQMLSQTFYRLFFKTWLLKKTKRQSGIPECNRLHSRQHLHSNAPSLSLPLSKRIDNAASCGGGGGGGGGGESFKLTEQVVCWLNPGAERRGELKKCSSTTTTPALCNGDEGFFLRFCVAMASLSRPFQLLPRLLQHQGGVTPAVASQVRKKPSSHPRFFLTYTSSRLSTHARSASTCRPPPPPPQPTRPRRSPGGRT